MKTIKYTAIGAALALLILLIWGAGVEPRLVDRREEIAVIPNLPAAWENKRIALIADLQVGMWLGNEGTVEKIVNRIIEGRPAAVLIAGDFVYKPTDEDEPEDVEREDVANFTSEVNRAVELIRPLVESGIPVYAVLGNHDYGMGYPDSVKNERLAVAVRSSLEAAGVHVLDNRAVPMVLPEENNAQNFPATTAPSSTLYIVGIGSRYAGNDKPEIAFSQFPDAAPRIILMHNPDSFAAFPAHTAPFAVAGHTHGGQIRIPFTDNWSWMALTDTNQKILTDGWIDGFGQAGNHLYVNRGIGFSSFPVRINCRPELTVFTLRRARDS
jgi:predicted MPP superfamily phosphohydrolase